MNAPVAIILLGGAAAMVFQAMNQKKLDENVLLPIPPPQAVELVPLSATEQAANTWIASGGIHALLSKPKPVPVPLTPTEQAAADWIASGGIHALLSTPKPVPVPAAVAPRPPPSFNTQPYVDMRKSYTYAVM